MVKMKSRYGINRSMGVIGLRTMHPYFPGHFFDGKVAIAYAGNDDLTVAVFDPPKTIVDFSDA